MPPQNKIPNYSLENLFIKSQNIKLLKICGSKKGRDSWSGQPYRLRPSWQIHAWRPTSRGLQLQKKNDYQIIKATSFLQSTHIREGDWEEAGEDFGWFES